MSFGEFSAVLNQVQTDGFNALRSDTLLADNDGYDNDSYQLSYTTPEWDGWSATLSAREVDAAADYDSCGRFDENFSFISSNDCSDGYKNATQGMIVRHRARGIQRSSALAKVKATERTTPMAFFSSR
jgi:outer membrane cobalamin receptor